MEVIRLVIGPCSLAARFGKHLSEFCSKSVFVPKCLYLLLVIVYFA